MSDKHDEMARRFPLPEPKRYFGHSTNSPMYDRDEILEYSASALRQVERETLELRATIASQINDELSGVSMSYGIRTRVGELLLKLAEEYRLSPTANELSTTSELADVSTPVKLIDREQSDGYVRVPRTLLDACKTKLQGKEHRELVKWIEQVAKKEE